MWRHLPSIASLVFYFNVNGVGNAILGPRAYVLVRLLPQIVPVHGIVHHAPLVQGLSIYFKGALATGIDAGVEINPFTCVLLIRPIVV